MPNKTVAAWRNRKWMLKAEMTFHERTIADITADQWRADNPNARVIVRAFKVGPKPSSPMYRGPMYDYAVRLYEVG